MSNFMNIKMDDWTIWGLIGSAVVTLIGFCMVMSENFGRSGTGPQDRVVKCANMGANCEFAESWTPEKITEYALANLERIKEEDLDRAEQMMQSIGGNSMMGPFPGMMMPGGQQGQSQEEMMERSLLSLWGNTIGPAFKCPQCSIESVYFATKCKECDTIFHLDREELYSDRCPNCGVSRREIRDKERLDEKKEKRDRRKERKNKK